MGGRPQVFWVQGHSGLGMGRWDWDWVVALHTDPCSQKYPDMLRQDIFGQKWVLFLKKGRKTQGRGGVRYTILVYSHSLPTHGITSYDSEGFRLWR